MKDSAVSAPRRRWIGLVALGGLVVVAGVGLIVAQPSTAGSPAALEVIDRSVEVRPPDGQFRDVRSGDSVTEGSVVRTNRTGLAALSYADGSLTRIGPSTTYEVTTLRAETRRREIVGKLDSGQTFHRVSRVTGNDSRFEVQTSKAVAAVRGTAFAVQCVVAQTCEIAVTEGVVAVRTPDGREIDVPAGRRVTVDEDGELGNLQLLSVSDPWLERNAELDDDASSAEDDSPAEDPDRAVTEPENDADSEDEPAGADEASNNDSAPSRSTAGPTTTAAQRLDFTAPAQPQPDRLDGSDDTTTTSTTTASQSTSTTRRPSSSSTTSTTVASSTTTTTQKTTSTTRRAATTSTAPQPSTTEAPTTTAGPTTTAPPPCDNGLPRDSNGECPEDACEGESSDCETTTTTEETTTTLRSCTEGPPPCEVRSGPQSTEGGWGSWGNWLGLFSMFAALGGVTYLPSRREPWSE